MGMIWHAWIESPQSSLAKRYEIIGIDLKEVLHLCLKPYVKEQTSIT